MWLCFFRRKIYKLKYLKRHFIICKLSRHTFKIFSSIKHYVSKRFENFKLRFSVYILIKSKFFLKFFFKLIQIIKNDKIFETYVYCKWNFWFISKLIRTFYNNIKKYDFMIKIRARTLDTEDLQVRYGSSEKADTA